MNKSKTLLKKQNRDEAALQKYAMISPLLDENLDPAAARELRCRENSPPYYEGLSPVLALQAHGSPPRWQCRSRSSGLPPTAPTSA